MQHSTSNDSGSGKRRILTFLVNNTPIFGWVHLIGLAAFVTLSIAGFFGAGEGAISYSNITSFWVWCVWWPGIVLIALLNSRLWCSICPIRFINQMVDKFGFNIKVPKVVRQNGIFIAIGLFLLHTIIISYSVDKFSVFTSLYLLSLLGLAVVVGLVFEKNAFCNSFCPLNGFIGTYSKVGTVELSPIDRDICKSCTTKECYQSCPAKLCMVQPAFKDTCIMCFKCVEECPKTNIELKLQSPFKHGLKKVENNGGLALITILFGIMIAEFGESWLFFDHLITAVPNWLKGLGIPELIFGYNWMEGFWINLSLPALFIFATSYFVSLVTGKKGLLSIAKKTAPTLLPLIFSMHLSKMLDVVNHYIGYGKNVVTDPIGVQTAKLLESGVLAMSANVLFTDTVQGVVTMVIVAIGMVASLYTTKIVIVDKLKSRRGKCVYYLAPTIVGLSALLVVANWFALI
ncbi:4Fe-4S binding protein [Vibrio sp. MACH09]|uniref:4Fe-4S binding protein n=1 Tax=Vibrio sp. MACH09 TaxID=3025122 RepID=UPI00295ED550|nr:4Fe-4S binding protein [Vibrio sp. MACH09]